MSAGRSRGRPSFIVLCAGLVLVTVVFGARVKYAPVAYYALAGIQITVISLAAWKLGAFAIRSESEERRRLAVAGGLLVTAWALFSLLPGIGPPGVQSHAENQRRYLILLINAIAIAGGLVVLRDALCVRGERFYSTLGFTAIMLAAPLYVIWAAMLNTTHGVMQALNSNEAPPWMIPLNDLSDTLLFFGGFLTYLATAAFAASLGRTQWLGPRAARTFVSASVIALLCLATRGLKFPDPNVVFTHWYTIPGFVVGVPAAPWIMPCMFGVALLRRAGDEPG